MAEDPAAEETIASLRRRIDEIDTALIQLWQERADLAQQVCVLRLSAGDTRLSLSGEYEVLKRFRDAIGLNGAQLGTLLLKAGRGEL
jgi:chorismate mutase